jgi:hypothetical protein
LSVKSQHGLNRDIHSTKAVFLEHNLSHLLAVLDRVHRRLGEENLPSRRVNPQLLLKGVVPEDLHVVPVLDDTVLHRLSELEVGTVLRCEVADHDVLDRGGFGRVTTLLGTEDRATDDRREGVGGEVC